MKPLQIAQKVALAGYSTMRLGGQASYAVGVSSRNELKQAWQWAVSRQLPCLVVGSGSNIVWRDEGFDGLLIVNQIKGYEAFDEDADNTYLTIGAGENWDMVVQRSVASGLSGIEALSLIPGTAGATPVQNVGAYGQDISQTLVSVEAFDTVRDDFVTIANADCGFGYRTSRFKGSDRGRYLISAITLHLIRANPQPPFYPALQKYLEDHGISQYTPHIIRQAVIAIRSSKLPNPNHIANNGSFFANPVISPDAFVQLAADYPAIPHWQVDEGIKLSAAWLIDQAGFKDYHDQESGMATWPHQSLVLVNEHATNTAGLLQFQQKLTEAVKAKFNIQLQQEPELLPVLQTKIGSNTGSS